MKIGIVFVVSFFVFLSCIGAEELYLRNFSVVDNSASNSGSVPGSVVVVPVSNLPMEIGSDIYGQISSLEPYAASIWIRYPVGILYVNKMVISGNGYSEEIKSSPVFVLENGSNYFVYTIDFNSRKFISGNSGKVNIRAEVKFKNFYYNVTKDFDISIVGFGNVGGSEFSTSVANTIYVGDLHVHSNLSSVAAGCALESDNAQGYTLTQIKTRAKALGMNFISISDHGYCLDSNKWKKSQTESARLSDSGFLFSSGEEISVDEDCIGGSDSGHLGSAFLNSVILPSPNNWFPRSPGSQSGINLVNQQGGISIINHPKMTAWDWKCINSSKNVSGIEIWNGLAADQNVINWWVKDFLLKGKKVYGYGGSDSHEPDLTKTTSMMGLVYNVVYSGSLSGIKTALKNGNSYLTNNGAFNFVISVSGINYGPGENVSSYKGAALAIKAGYNVNSGCSLRLCRGVIGNVSEVCYNIKFISGSGIVNMMDWMDKKGGYYRAECYGDSTRRIITNPIWISGWK